MSHVGVSVSALRCEHNRAMRMSHETSRPRSSPSGSRQPRLCSVRTRRTIEPTSESQPTNHAVLVPGMDKTTHAQYLQRVAKAHLSLRRSLAVCK